MQYYCRHKGKFKRYLYCISNFTYKEKYIMWIGNRIFSSMQCKSLTPCRHSPANVARAVSYGQFPAIKVSSKEHFLPCPRSKPSPCHWVYSDIYQLFCSCKSVALGRWIKGRKGESILAKLLPQYCPCPGTYTALFLPLPSPPLPVPLTHTPTLPAPGLL